MTILFEKWPRRVEIYPWDEAPATREPELDQPHLVTDIGFLDTFEAAAFLRDLAAEPDLMGQLRNLCAAELTAYRYTSNEEVIEQFAGLVAQHFYRVRQTEFFRTAWPIELPAPPPSPQPNIPPKRTDPPKPVENKAVLVEFIEVVNRGVEGVVTGAGPASSILPTCVERSDIQKGFYKQFINVTDKDLEGTSKRHPEYGRYIEVKARVTLNGKPKAGESVEFHTRDRPVSSVHCYLRRTSRALTIREVLPPIFKPPSAMAGLKLSGFIYQPMRAIILNYLPKARMARN